MSVQPLAAWLVARPRNGGIGLLVTTLLLPFPLSFLVGGMVVAHLVFAVGLPRTTIIGFGAGTTMALVALILNVSVSQIVTNAVVAWLPVMVLAGLGRHLRSLTLTFQVSVIIAVAVVLAFFVVLGNPVDFWNTVVTESVALFREAGAGDYADWLVESRSVIVPQMTMLMVFVGWSTYTLVLLLAYALYQYLPGKAAVFGRFCDLNFGRVLAGVVGVASVLAVVTGSVLLQNVAFLILVTFWLQGLALLHWLYAEKNLPAFVLIATYVFMLPLIGVMMIAFSVLGYLDAWFSFRARSATSQA
jgi:hypothetical protein